MFFLLFKLLVWVASVLVVAGAVVWAFAIVGGPEPCEPVAGRIVVSPANARAFDRKWASLDAALAAGKAAAISLTDSEITSRARPWIAAQSGDVADVRVCVHRGIGEVTGEVELPVGTAKFRATGTIALRGGSPEVTFEEIEVGSVPGVVLSPLEGVVETAIEELLDDITLDRSYAVALREGSARVAGGP